MKGKDLIKWIQENKAENLDFFVGNGDGWRYDEASPEIKKASKGKRLCIMTDEYVEEEQEAKAQLLDASYTKYLREDSSLERTVGKWVDLYCLYFEENK